MTDAITGIAICGQTITGVIGDQIPQGGLELGANPANVFVVQNVALAAPEAGITFGVAAAPTLTISSTITPDEAGLLLGASPAFYVGQQWLWELDCESVALVAADCQAITLQPLTSR